MKLVQIRGLLFVLRKQIYIVYALIPLLDAFILCYYGMIIVFKLTIFNSNNDTESYDY